MIKRALSYIIPNLDSIAATMTDKIGTHIEDYDDKLKQMKIEGFLLLSLIILMLSLQPIVSKSYILSIMYPFIMFCVLYVVSKIDLTEWSKTIYGFVTDIRGNYAKEVKETRSTSGDSDE